MRVLFTTLREKSHFLPLLPFIEACRGRGHEVAVAAPPDCEERARATGAAFFPVGHPGDEGLRPTWLRMRSVPPEEVMPIVLGELFAGLCAGAALPSLIETLGSFRPGIVLRESFEFAGMVAAEKVGIPHARVAICATGTEAEIRSLAATAVDAHRRGVHLPPDPSGDRIRDEPAVTLFPASFEPGETAPGPLFRFRAARKEAAPLPDWWGSRKDPLVYVTLGTVTGGLDIMRAAYRVALDALVDLPIRVLLTVGSNLPMETLGEVPPNVHVERFVPQDDVIPHAAVVLCHGGSGTVLGTLAAGVPMVVAPIFADQPYNAACVAAAGAGLAVPERNATSEQLRGALSRVLREESFRSAARKIAGEIATLPLVDDSAARIEQIASPSR